MIKKYIKNIKIRALVKSNHNNNGFNLNKINMPKWEWWKGLIIIIKKNKLV